MGGGEWDNVFEREIKLGSCLFIIFLAVNEKNQR